MKIILQKIAEVSNNSLITHEILDLLHRKLTGDELLLFNKWLDIVKLRQDTIELDSKCI